MSQNNVAKEAGTDPTALKKARHPALVREIQAQLEIAGHEVAAQKVRRLRNRQRREDLATKSKRFQAQRDHAQAQLVSAQRRVLALLHENTAMKVRLAALLPPLRPLRR